MTIAPRSIRLVLVVVLSLFVAAPSIDVYAKGSKGGSSGGTKTVHVKGHTTKNGKYVPPHDRSSPTKHKSTSSTGVISTPHSTSTGSTSVKRDANGRIERSEAT